MKKVMTRAWEIAKEGASKFGGKVKEYLAEALKMAWAETKAVDLDPRIIQTAKVSDGKIVWLAVKDYKGMKINISCGNGHYTLKQAVTGDTYRIYTVELTIHKTAYVTAKLNGQTQKMVLTESKITVA